MNDKRLLIVIGISLIIILITILFSGIFLNGLQSVFKLTGRMSSLSIGLPEFISLGFMPLWTYLLLKQKRQSNSRKIVFQTLVVFTLIVAFVGIGILVIVVFEFKTSPLFPDYIVNQPFHGYWSIFILAGILTGRLFMRNEPTPR